MLLVAKKLPLFEIIGIKKDVIECFSEVLQAEAARTIVLENAGLKVDYLSADVWRDAIDSAVLFTLLTYGKDKLAPEIYKSLLALCRTDKELNNFVQEIVKEQTKRFKTTMSFMADWEGE